MANLPLADNALQVHFDDLLKQQTAIVFYMIQVKDAWTLSPQQFLQQRFSLDEWQHSEIFPIEVQQVKRDKHALTTTKKQIIETSVDPWDQLCFSGFGVREGTKTIDLQFVDKLLGVERLKAAGRPKCGRTATLECKILRPIEAEYLLRLICIRRAGAWARRANRGELMGFCRPLGLFHIFKRGVWDGNVLAPAGCAISRSFVWSIDVEFCRWRAD
jgi:hypothetical protein